ncbi:TraB/GumN family protein [Paraglaciecola sp. MB-3u-78]|uniref:TraB/GumN family protein n=1 Tax=Paraglaciecola sp. MB-3u-78 TaxID=2058332 RepID=UPI000C33B2F4|nr:TraB/GumN family protein [Paraglaciecola sp. MB-3u-78]PKG96737.1 TraB/GumN family protein [Paraglaciecola sp. MB-3u-78]
MTLIKAFTLSTVLLFTLDLQAASVWKVTNNQHSLYIGGTIHVLTPKDYPLAKEYDLAYQASDKVIFETDMEVVSSPAFGQKMMDQMMYSDGTTINTVLQPDTYKALAIHLSSREIPMQAFASHKPSLLAISLTFIELQAMGYTSVGVDMFFANMAKTQAKEQGWLETPDEQLAFISKLGGDDPNAMIEYTLKDIKKMPEMFAKLHSTWLAGDMQGMADVGITPFKADYPTIYQDLLVTRNNNWLPKIVNMLNDPSIEFILVGALHLAGPDSVLAKLKAKGYKIEKL